MNFRQWMIMAFLCAAAAPLGAHPRTEVKVDRPKTSATVSRPATTVSVVHPKTTVQTYRPTTSVQVIHPKTDVVVVHPKTEVTVSHPTTSVQVTHPGEVSAGKTDSSGSASAGGKKTSAPAAGSSSAKTSMSDYQPPKAKDFKAASLGGSSGLGKTDEAAKDAAAASFKLPKGDEASLEAVLKSAQGVSSSKITKAVEKKVK